MAHKEMVFIFTSEQAVAPPSTRPQLSTEASEKCPAGRWSVLQVSCQHSYLFLIISHTSEDVKEGEETPC